MSNVAPIQTPKVGDHIFMMCGCNPQEPQPFVPIILLQQNPIIVGLQCLACKQHLTAVNGVIQEPVPANDG